MRAALAAVALLFLAQTVPAAPATPAAPAAQAGPGWRTAWNDSAFTEAARDHKFVLLDLHAVWCHWCHVMDTTTYADPAVQAEISKHYVAVSVDADSDPALTSRYGDWGWPATIVLAADGTEIVKRRGYIAPAQMLSLLEAIVTDPTPGPSVTAPLKIASSNATSLTAKDRTKLAETVDSLYDTDNAGWGAPHKFVDAAAAEWSFANVDAGDQLAMTRVRRTLDANRNLIDSVWGGVFQYSDSLDWKSPHYEKLLSYQADDLRIYSEAYSRWHRKTDLEAAQKIYGYMTSFLSAPDGGFYVSQDADVSPKMTGHDYYAKDDAGRRAAGMPKIDTHEYSRETGWAIRALCKYYDVTGEPAALARAQRGAEWALNARKIAGGGFNHAAADGVHPDLSGPFLDDNISMAQALVALYRSTGNREWLKSAAATLNVIDSKLRDPRGGYVASPPPSNTRGVFREPVRDVAQNVAVVHAANMIYRYCASDGHLQIARHAMKYLAGFAAAAHQQFRPDILLADQELSAAPIHITVVGHKDDPAAQLLHAAALQYPTDYLQVDWWDKREGRLPDPSITYPELKQAAAFACTANACSAPVFEPGEIQERVRSGLSQ
jgi:uncharacterized protein YyaL (SSP411 family)